MKYVRIANHVTNIRLTTNNKAALLHYYLFSNRVWNKSIFKKYIQETEEAAWVPHELEPTWVLAVVMSKEHRIRIIIYEQ